MLFCDVNLARRIEQAECRLLADAVELIRCRPGRSDALAMPIAGGLAAYTGPGEPYNKLAGLGFAGPVEESELEAIEREFAQRNTPLQVELSTIADNSIGALLTRRGYVLVAYENVLGLRLNQEAMSLFERSARPPEAGLRVAEASPEETPAWIDTVITGFQHPDTVEGLTPHESYPRELLEQVMSSFAMAPGFRRYLAWRNGEIAGGASLRLGEGIAQLCGAATLPAHRRHGVQSALLRARLEEGARAGCDIATMTAQQVGSKSQENAHRQGFVLLYARAILRKEP